MSESLYQHPYPSEALAQEHPFVEYDPVLVPHGEAEDRGNEFLELMDRRRSVRLFSDEPVDASLIELAVATASTAPSGAHKQPWTFCAVSNPAIKTKIRIAAEEEEYKSYHGRMSEEWLEDLAPLGTDEHKPFLEIAPWLIIVFKKTYDIIDGQKKQNYFLVNFHPWAK